MRNFKIRNIEPEDLAEIYTKGCDIVESPEIEELQWVPDNIAEIVGRDPAFSFAAFQGKKMLSFVICARPFAGEKELLRIYWMASLQGPVTVLDKLFERVVETARSRDIKRIDTFCLSSETNKIDYFSEKGFTNKNSFLLIEHFL